MRRAIAFLALALGWWSSVYPKDPVPCKWTQRPCPMAPGEHIAWLPAGQMVGSLDASGKPSVCWGEEGTPYVVSASGDPLRYATCCNPVIAPLPPRVPQPTGSPLVGPPGPRGMRGLPGPPGPPGATRDALHQWEPEGGIIYGGVEEEDRGSWCKRHKAKCTLAIIGGIVVFGAAIDQLSGDDDCGVVVPACGTGGCQPPGKHGKPNGDDEGPD